LIPIFLAQMSSFKSTKVLRGDKLPCLYSLNNWNVSFLEFLEFGPFLALCLFRQIILKFSLVSTHDVEGEDNSEDKGEEIFQL